MDEQTLAEIEEWIGRLKDNHYRHEHTGFAWSIASKTPNLIAALRTAQAQLAQERERVKVLEERLRYITDCFSAYLYDHGELIYPDIHPNGGYWESIREANAALSVVEQQATSRNGNSNG